MEKDDIPMQRQYCREFIERNPEWVLTNELYEKGISGFKVSAKERDAIQEMQRDAVQGKFEILLVYMFDRLGRKDDETPFVVEWFVQNGIEVWSAVVIDEVPLYLHLQRPAPRRMWRTIRLWHDKTGWHYG